MKHILFLVVLVSLMVGPVLRPLAADEGWVPLGPPGGQVTHLLVHPKNPQILWAGTPFDGLYRSNDGGVSWFAANKGLDRRNRLDALAVAPADPQTLYAAADGRIYRSDDGGLNWMAVLPCGTKPPPCCGCVPLARVAQLVVHPREPRIVFAVTYVGLFKSLDGGAQWRRIQVPTGPIDFLVFEPGNPRVLYATRRGELFKSTNGGVSWVLWSKDRVQVSIQRLVIDPKNPRRMWTGGSGGIGVSRSTDGGVHWRLFNGGLTNFNADALVLGPTSGSGAPPVWIGNSDGLFRSLDGGVTWRNLFRNRFVASVAVHPVRPETVWVGTHPSVRSTSGVFKSVNRGTTWTFSSRGISNAETYCVAFDPVTPGVLWAANLAGVWRSEDDGSSWSARDGNIPAHVFVLALAVDPGDPETIWAGTTEGAFITEDGGATWKARRQGMTGVGPNPFASVRFLRIAPSNPSVVYAGTDNALFRTIDGGGHWTPVSSPPFDPPAIFAPGDLLIDPRDPNVIFVAQGDLWSSRDGGSTWSQVSLPVGEHTIRVAGDPQDPDILYVGNERGVLRSPDGGQTWELVTDLLISFYGEIAVGPAGEVWAGDVGGIYFSSDGLSGWTLLPGLHAHVLSALEADPHHPSTVVASTSNILAPGTFEGLFRHTGD